MAKKGQKYEKYSLEFKNELLKYYQDNNCSTYELSRQFNIPRNTIKNWIYVPEKSLSILKRGRPKDSTINYKERYEILKKYQAFLKEQQEKK